MRDFFSKLKIPTILGLGVIILGIVSGVFLTLRDQSFTSSASPNISPQNLIISNVSENEVTISWQTSVATPSFITYGQAGPDEQTVLDDRDTSTPNPYLLHYLTIKNLLPKTTYQYKIYSGKIPSGVNTFTTASPLNLQTGFRPIIGSVMDGSKPLQEGIAYISIADATTQSALVKAGNFLIPISQIRSIDLSDSFPLTDDSLIKLTVISSSGQANAIFKYNDTQDSLAPLKIGEDLDFTTQPAEQIDYDLNDDESVNSADYSIVRANQGTNPKEKSADLNKDGVVDQKDLDLMIQKIKELGAQ